MSMNDADGDKFIPRYTFAKMLGISRWKADRIIASGTVTVRQFPGLSPEVLLRDAEALTRRSIRRSSVAV